MLLLVLPVLLIAVVWGAQQVAAEQELARRYEAASASFDRQDWPQAVAGFEAVVSLRPWYRDASAKLETSRREVRLLNDYGAAMERYGAGAWADAVQKLGALATDAPGYKDVDARLADAKRELRLEQQYTQAAERLQSKSWSEAVSIIEALLKEAPGYRDAEGKLAEARRDYPTAKAQFKEAAEQPDLLPYDEAVFRLNLASAMIPLRDYQAAQAEFARTEKLAPEYAEAQAMYGYLYEEQERYQEAIAAYGRAIAKRPKHGPYYARRGAVLVLLDRYSEALADGTRAVELGSADKGQVVRAVAFVGLKDLARARQAAQAALDANPDNKDAQEILRLLSR